MKTFRSSGLIVIALILTVLLAACGDSMGQGTPANTASQSMKNGNSTNNNSGNGMAYGTPTAKSTMGSNNNGNGNMNNNNNGNMMGGITITPSMGGNTAAFIHTGMANINGKHVNVLMTNKGYAVYYYRADTMFKATCTGDCAKSWPPILAPQGMMTVSSSMTLPRQLSVHQTMNGTQLFYDGHALYTYASDMQPGTATGRAQDQLWYLVGLTL